MDVAVGGSVALGVCVGVALGKGVNVSVAVGVNVDVAVGGSSAVAIGVYTSSSVGSNVGAGIDGALHATQSSTSAPKLRYILTIVLLNIVLFDKLGANGAASLAPKSEKLRVAQLTGVVTRI